MLPRGVKLAGGVAVYGAGVLVAYEVTRPQPALPSASCRCCTFSTLAPKYDAEIEKDESTSGILALRGELATAAHGRVLEIAGGTGRNLPYYPPSVSSLLITDNSEPMLQQAARKVAEGAGAQAALDRSSVTLAVVDASALDLPSGSFDTVVDTFGLCSFERPAEALREMQRVCKPGGSILLLEHGVSDWTLLARWQQHRLNRHVQRWGCYWNRDIEALVRESGLKVVEAKRQHFGTTYWMRCEPGGGTAV
mgnify:CR=1 FL=1